MNIEQIEARMAEIQNELDKPEADLDALQEEVRSLNEQREQLKRAAAEAEEKRRQIAEGVKKTEVIEEHREERTMTDLEVRGSAEYTDAFARYIVSGNDKECRAMLTANVNGDVPVPVLVDNIVRTAWENNDILSRVRKTNFRGNVKVAFEASATGAVVHTEGTDAPNEEQLRLGIVNMVPANIKKWIKVSDEVVAMGGEAMISYVYSELTYQVLKKLAADVIGDITALPTSNTPGDPGVPAAAKLTGKAPSLTVISEAYAQLSDEADSPVIIMNRLTYADFKAAYAAGNFAVDPFEGMTVVFTSALPAYGTASASDVYCIVGDLTGAQVNYPEGEGIRIKYDDVTLAEADMVKIVGRQYAAHAVTAPFRFTNIAK